MRKALPRLRCPVHLIHGDADDFAPIDLAEQLASEVRTRHPVRFERVAGANHFMNDGPAELLLGALESCIPQPTRHAFAFRLPRLKLPSLAPRPEMATA
jgi:pimeloyl-ACP methyl ester carboxylesterase